MKGRGPDPVRNVYMLELIGTRLKVLDHSDPGLIGRQGVVVDETKGTILIRSNGRESRIQKKNGRFEIMVKTGKGFRSVLIDGNDILIRPVYRTKKCEKMSPSTITNQEEGPKDPPRKIKK
jgi:ribonuclease P protein subunit POP4